jgi:HD-GYP domain-containing protein (c-di-GMP phosphodiesterase class II)
MQAEQELINFEGISDLTPDDVETQYKQLVLDAGNLEFQINHDITNRQGTLLVRAGSAIDDKTYHRILQHKLMQPLDEYLQFTQQVELNAIVHEMLGMGEEMFGSLNINFDKTISTVRLIISELQYDNIMLNKLTVFRSRNIARFNHSIASAFYSIEIGRHLGMSKEQLCEMFTVCLFHDVGEMFINKEILQKENLDNEEFRILQTHPIISYMILRNSKTELSAAVLQGVLNHHERLDANGYPRRLGKNQLGLYERIMAVVDVYDAIRRKGQTPDDALWAIQLDSYQRSITGETIQPMYDSQVVNMLDQCLKHETDLEEDERDITDYPQLMSSIEKLFTEMGEINSVISDLRMKVDNILLRSEHFSTEAQLILRNARNTLYKIRHMIMDSSGLLIDDLHSLVTTLGDYYAIRKDVLRIIPELQTYLQKIGREMASLNTQGIQGIDGILKMSTELLSRLEEIEARSRQDKMLH